MRTNNISINRFLFGFALLLLIGKFALAQDIPDFTRGDSIPKGANHDWNLGPTGARGWMYSNKLETSQARQILVTQVASGSPVDGKLRINDVIVGVSGSPFSSDPRVELGKAIGLAEAGNGSLRLLVWRSGRASTEPERVEIQLQSITDYSDQAPFQCQKSKWILERGCKVLAARMKKNPKAGNQIPRVLNALALLASGQPEYLPLVQQQVELAAKYSDPESRMLHSWYYGPVNMLLAEYTLATGDKSYLSDLRRISMEIVRGQSAVGSWGHRFARPDGRLNGYGMMNAPGLPLTLSLVLARKAGVKDRALDQAIDQSTRLIRFYVGKGCVPYGDHAPWIETHDDNGKNGIAAVMFNLLGDAEAAEYFSKMSVASHGAEREMGHTGNFFNILWAMPGVAISGPKATGPWMKEFGWYYDLARHWDGSFPHQGPPELRPDRYKNWDATGAILLAYAQPLRKIYLTGKHDGTVKEIDTATANALIEDGRDYSHRLKHVAYSGRSVDQLFQGLGSWSPVVRERSATALSHRKVDEDEQYIDRLVQLLEGSNLHEQLGACQALAKFGKRADVAVDALEKTLGADDLWLRVKAAEALGNIGRPARATATTLLGMLTKGVSEDDPRAMEQRFLCFALFNKRSGLLRGSLDGIDRQSLYRAVRAGLHNEDGRARGAISTVYQKLTFDEIKILLPAIHRAVVEPSPSGEMFADEIRLAGLRILSKHLVREGIDLCVSVIENDRWGSNRRLPICLQALQGYGGAAKPVLPALGDLLKEIESGKKSQQRSKQIELLNETIRLIQSDDRPPTVRSLTEIASR